MLSTTKSSNWKKLESAECLPFVPVLLRFLYDERGTVAHCCPCAVQARLKGKKRTVLLSGWIIDAVKSPRTGVKGCSDVFLPIQRRS